MVELQILTHPLKRYFMKKNMRISHIPTTKGISITLPVPLIDKLNQLDISGQGVNVSRAIRFILEEYFEATGDGDIFPKIDPQSCLIPTDLYSELLGIGKITIKSRASKGEIKIISMFNTDFVQLDKDDILNYFAQVQLLKKEVKEVKSAIVDLRSHYDMFNTVIKEFQQSKK